LFGWYWRSDCNENGAWLSIFGRRVEETELQPGRPVAIRSLIGVLRRRIRRGVWVALSLLELLVGVLQGIQQTTSIHGRHEDSSRNAGPWKEGSDEVETEFGG